VDQFNVRETIVKRQILAGLMSALVVFAATAVRPALADDNDRLEQIAKQLQDLKDQNDRLQAEVDYLKANALAARKDAANEAVTVATLSSTASVAASKYTWSGDFRFRRELIDAEENVTGRARDRVRVRFGVLAKVNDSINAKIQLATTNSGNDNARSTNQTLGTGWDRKPLSVDLAYVDWKASPTLNLVLGKQPIPWTTTVSYFWDKDLTPEGAALKYVRGPWFGGIYYTDLNERDSAASSAASTDANLTAAQFGWKKAVGKYTFTGALAYFDVNGVQDRIVSGAGTGCSIDGAFGSGQGTGNNAFGNTSYTGAAPGIGSSTVCTRLRNDYNLIEALGQLDFTAGKYPISLFVDYIKNNGVLSSVTDKQDTAYAAGFLFNKAAAAKSWELGLVYQRTEKDAQFGQFHDSDFGGGVTDNKGYVLKAAYVPLSSWTLNAQYIINDRFVDPLDAVVTRNYKRLQLDLNYKY
jgi:outer membrane murein-binding lipoprotein Lpp